MPGLRLKSGRRIAEVAPIITSPAGPCEQLVTTMGVVGACLKALGGRQQGIRGLTKPGTFTRFETDTELNHPFAME